MSNLLSRDDFRNSVFSRDGYRCVHCGEKALDAHHIMERRLFVALEEFGGYFIENGVSVCGECHLLSEQTLITPNKLRECAKIDRIILPSHLYDDQEFDKWGNIVLANKRRLKGELFYDESVQKILKEGNVLHLFDKHVKYPRTLHFEISQGRTKDDRVHHSLDQFKDKEVIISTKMDGENSTLYNDYIHARSLDSRNHPSRNWLKNFWASIRHDIAEGMRVCGENLFAKHSIKYDNLETYFYGFSVWNENICLSWDETLEWFQLLGIKSVPVLYRGKFSEEVIKNLENQLDFEKNEGFVMRISDSFSYGEFKKYMAKYVRASHVQSTVHNWMNEKMEVNSLTKD